MRTVAVLALLTSVLVAEDRFLLLGIRRDTRLLPQNTPVRTELTVDVYAAPERVATRRLAVLDPKVRAQLYRDPFLVPEQPGLVLLAVSEPDGRGLRLLRFALDGGTQLGKSFVVPAGLLEERASRPLLPAPGRIAYLTQGCLHTLDLRLQTFTCTKFGGRPLHLDRHLNRLYVLSDLGMVRFHPLIVAEPPPLRLALKSKPHFRLPGGGQPVRAALRPDGRQIAYSSQSPTKRPDTRRFLLHVANDRSRLLLRRSVPGRLFDLRWLDDHRLLMTTTDGEANSMHVVSVKSGEIRSTDLGKSHLAPPEMVRADLLGLRPPG
ncbi:MAG: hypothetical protein ACYSX0_11145 [Planctomycetota bacterium]